MTEKVFTCVVVGSIGAGKSSMCRAMADQSNVGALEGVHVVLVPEPVDAWTACGALDNFLSSPPRYAAAFQHMAFNTRIQLWVKTWRERVLPLVARNDVKLVVVVLERSPKCDRLLFADQMRDDGVFTAEEYALYTAWFDYCVRLAPSDVDLYIDINTPLDETLARITRRADEDPARAGEKSYDRAYLARLHARQRAIFDRQLYGADAATLHVDGMLPFHTDNGVLLDILRRVRDVGTRAAMKRSTDRTPSPDQRTSSPDQCSALPDDERPLPLGDDFTSYVRQVCNCSVCAV